MRIKFFFFKYQTNAWLSLLEKSHLIGMVWGGPGLWIFVSSPNNSNVQQCLGITAPGSLATQREMCGPRALASPGAASAHVKFEKPCCELGVLQLSLHQSHQEGSFVKTQVAGPIPSGSDSVVLGHSLIICMFKFPGVAAAGPFAVLDNAPTNQAIWLGPFVLLSCADISMGTISNPFKRGKSVCRVDYLGQAMI